MGWPRWSVALALPLWGCLTVYQPLSALVDTQAPNFEGLSVWVRCLPGESLNQGEANRLCQHIGTLFTAQGAQVELGRTRATFDEEKGRPTDLIIDLKSGLLHQGNDPFLWLLCFGTLTLIPAMSESTLALDVMMRDAEGFLLSEDSLQARFVRYFGAGAV